MKGFRCKILAAAVCFSAILTGPACRTISEKADSVRDRILKQPETPPASPIDSIHLLLGNPSSAGASDRDNFLLVRSTAAYSYNNSRGTANWASWRTTRNDLGPSIPRPDFEPDPTLPGGFRRIIPSDYSGSGYDRGHLVPSADRFGDRSANRETFLMTNIVPQSADLNQFVWEHLESYSRSLARKGFDIYTVAGVYGDGGRIRRKITIPTNCWKIVVAVRAGSRLEDISPDTRVIAVDMPNAKGIARTGWKQYLTTGRALEQRTGYDFFSNLPPELQDVLENKIDGR